MTYTADFMGQSALFLCISMSEVLLSYAKAIVLCYSYSRVFLYMADDHAAKVNLTDTSHMTLISLSKSQQPF